MTNTGPALLGQAQPNGKSTRAQDQCLEVAYHSWVGLGPIPTSRQGMAKEGIVKTRAGPLITVSALRKSAAKHYSALGASSKEFLEWTSLLGFWVEVGLHGN